MIFCLLFVAFSSFFRESGRDDNRSLLSATDGDQTELTTNALLCDKVYFNLQRL